LILIGLVRANHAPMIYARQKDAVIYAQPLLKSFFLGDMCLFQTKATRRQTPNQGFALPSVDVISEYRLSCRAADHNHICARSWSPSHPAISRFSQDSSVTTAQTANTRFLGAKQILGSRHLVATRPS
jgi:hypothetical protein